MGILFLKDHFLEENIRVATLFSQKHNKKKIDFCVVRTNKEVIFDWKEKAEGKQE